MINLKTLSGIEAILLLLQKDIGAELMKRTGALAVRNVVTIASIDK